MISAMSSSKRRALCVTAILLNRSLTTAQAESFATLHRGMVILEGFPTQAGENPAFIIQSIGHRADPEANSYERGESAFAAALSSENGIAFIGGEPTEREELEHLVSLGYTRDEVAFAFLLRELG